MSSPWFFCILPFSYPLPTTMEIATDFTLFVGYVTRPFIFSFMHCPILYTFLNFLMVLDPFDLSVKEIRMRTNLGCLEFWQFLNFACRI